VYYDLIVWDDEDDPNGNHRHVVATGEVTTEEVEEILANHVGPWSLSRCSGNPIIQGVAANGRRIAVVFIVLPDPNDILIYPVTAFGLDN
jgi:hypothetical protein